MNTTMPNEKHTMTKNSQKRASSSLYENREQTEQNWNAATRIAKKEAEEKGTSSTERWNLRGFHNNSESPSSSLWPPVQRSQVHCLESSSSQP